jgi:hypothetical protein
MTGSPAKRRDTIQLEATMNQYQLLVALRTMDELIARKRPARDRPMPASRAFRAQMTPSARQRDVMLSLGLIVVLLGVLAAVAAPGTGPGF